MRKSVVDLAVSRALESGDTVLVGYSAIDIPRDWLPGCLVQCMRVQISIIYWLIRVSN